MDLRMEWMATGPAAKISRPHPGAGRAEKTGYARELDERKQMRNEKSKGYARELDELEQIYTAGGSNRF